MMKDNDTIFDIAETARFLKVSEQTVYKLLRRGDIAAAKVGREWRILKPAVIEFLRQGNKPARKAGRPKNYGRRQSDRTGAK